MVARKLEHKQRNWCLNVFRRREPINIGQMNTKQILLLHLSCKHQFENWNFYYVGRLRQSASKVCCWKKCKLSIPHSLFFCGRTADGNVWWLLAHDLGTDVVHYCNADKIRGERKGKYLFLLLQPKKTVSPSQLPFELSCNSLRERLCVTYWEKYQRTLCLCRYALFVTQFLTPI